MTETAEHTPRARRMQERERMLHDVGVQPIQPEDVPADWVQAAEDHYSMHGTGLIRNILAGVAPLIQVAERAAMDRVRAFEVDRNSSVMLTCPDCDELLWLAQGDEVETLGDVIDAVVAHKCPSEVLAALLGEETPDGS